MTDVVLLKASTWVEPHYLDVWGPAHLGVEEAT
jgi:hypothetical protein